MFPAVCGRGRSPASATATKLIVSERATSPPFNVQAYELTPKGEELMPVSYEDEIKQIIALDADGKAGLKVKYESIQLLPKILEQLELIQDDAENTEGALQKISELEQKFKPAGMALLEVNYARALPS